MGHVALKGKWSSLFLCMDAAGRLRGQVQPATTCPSSKPSILPVLHRQLTPPSPPAPPFSSLDAVRGGRLHLQRAAAGRRIHALPVLAPRLAFVSGAQTVPGPPRRPLHSLPAAQEYLGRGEHVWSATKQPQAFRRGLGGSSGDGSAKRDQSTVLSGEVTGSDCRFSFWVGWTCRLDFSVSDLIIFL